MSISIQYLVLTYPVDRKEQNFTSCLAVGLEVFLWRPPYFGSTPQSSWMRAEDCLSVEGIAEDPEAPHKVVRVFQANFHALFFFFFSGNFKRNWSLSKDFRKNLSQTGAFSFPLKDCLKISSCFHSFFNNKHLLSTHYAPNPVLAARKKKIHIGR